MEQWTLTVEAWRLKMECWRFVGQAAADSHHFDDKQDPYPDPYQSKNSDPDLQCKKMEPDPDPH